MNLFQSRENSQDLSETERLAWLRLIRTENIGPITFYQLVERFGSASEALHALPDLSKKGGRKRPLIPASEKQIEREYKQLQKMGGQLITVEDTTYPLALTAIDDAPPVLSILGNQKQLNQSCLAIVGARNASLNGKKFAHKLAQDLGGRAQTIVSGLARGIDTAAHQGSIENGTIAVVASGLDVVYPEENHPLYDEIKEKGTIIAESPMGTKPYAAAFPRRNRIVSGISKGVVVVEATKRSGSLITARLAGEQGRDVFAVPGSPFDPRSAGPNHLIREGATLITSANDIMEILMSFSGNAMREPPTQALPFTVQSFEQVEETYDNALQEKILSHLSFTPILVDELIRACHVTIATLHNVLLELELAGRIKRLPGNRVSLVEEI
ncbi:MAG: DNA-processing protein DprA [Alphaproteobacteria bacterium]